MSSRIKKIKRRTEINLGLVFLLCLVVLCFIYIILPVISFFSSKHIVGYEVKTGSLSITNVYEGIAIREESIQKSSKSGFVNYYAREGEKVSSGSAVCSVDETGQLQDIMTKKKADGDVGLQEQDYREIEGDITNFLTYFDKSSFASAYDFKYLMKGNVAKYFNRNLLTSLSTMEQQLDDGLVSMVNAPASGIVIYSVDGFENKKVNEVTAEWFNKENYEKAQLINNNLVAPGDILYKMTNNENWYIVIETDAERAKELLEEEYIRVKFLKNQTESWGKAEMITGTDEKIYVSLLFNNSMVNFATDRFIDIELITNQESGLKVPNSAIIDKNFFVIPEGYLDKTGSEEMSAHKIVYDQDGKEAVEAVPVTIYNFENGEYYIDEEALSKGDQIRKVDSNESFTISKEAPLVGVYNINKGYADFKQIQIINSNDEYSIIKSNTAYGLMAYDHIVLDAESVAIEEFVYD